MNVLLCKNTHLNSLSTLENFLHKNEIMFDAIKLHYGEILPDIDDYDAVVLMGGPMSANDERKYPFIAQEIEIARRCLNENKKLLGICLGSQIMAKAFGGRVYQGAQKEIGWYDLNLSSDMPPDKIKCALSQNPETRLYENNFKVFQWHGDTFELPQNVKHLASSELYKNQGFKYNDITYALQFHIEISQAMIDELISLSSKPHEILEAETSLHLKLYNDRAYQLYHAFFQI
jgi:GMP synthase-like glutamine amidotransferase